MTAVEADGTDEEVPDQLGAKNEKAVDYTTQMKLLHAYENKKTRSLDVMQDVAAAVEVGEKGYYVIQLQPPADGVVFMHGTKRLKPQIGVPVDEFRHRNKDGELMTGSPPPPTEKPYEEYENNFVAYVLMSYHLVLVSPRICYEEMQAALAPSIRTTRKSEAQDLTRRANFTYGEVVYFNAAGKMASSIPMLFLSGVQVRKGGTATGKVKEAECVVQPEFVAKCAYFKKVKAVVFMQTAPQTNDNPADGECFVVDPHHLIKLESAPVSEEEAKALKGEEEELHTLFKQLQVLVPAACTGGEFGTTSVNIPCASFSILTDFTPLNTVSDFPQAAIARAKMVLEHASKAASGGDDDDNDEDEDEGEDEDPPAGQVACASSSADAPSKPKPTKPKRVRKGQAKEAKQYSTNATSIVSLAKLKLEEAMKNNVLTEKSLAEFKKSVFVEAEAWWAKIRAAKPSSTAGTEPKKKAEVILTKAKEMLNTRTTNASNSTTIDMQQLKDMFELLTEKVQAPAPPPPLPAPENEEVIRLRLDLAKREGADSERARLQASAPPLPAPESDELMRLRLDNAKREGADQVREQYQKKEGHMEVSYESQLELMKQLARAEAKNELVAEADARVDTRVTAQQGQQNLLINTIATITQQAVGMLQVPQAGPPQLQVTQAGHPQMQGPQACHPQLQGPQAGTFAGIPPQWPQAGIPQQWPPAGLPQLQGPQAGPFLQFGSMSAFNPLQTTAESPSSCSSPTPYAQFGTQFGTPFCGDCGGERSATKFCSMTGKPH